MNLVLASNNAGKLAELQALFAPLDVTLVVCVKSGYFRAHVKAALEKVFSNQRNGD